MGEGIFAFTFLKVNFQIMSDGPTKYKGIIFFVKSFFLREIEISIADMLSMCVYLNLWNKDLVLFPSNHLFYYERLLV